MKKTIRAALLLLALLLLAVLCTAGCKIETHTHVFSEKKVGDAYFASAATCTEPAKYYYSCACGEKGAETFAHGEALGHHFTNYIPDGNATCTKDGTKTAKCDRCDAVDTVTDVNSKIAHTFDRKVTTDAYLASAATCTEPARYYFPVPAARRERKPSPMAKRMATPSTARSRPTPTLPRRRPMTRRPDTTIPVPAARRAPRHLHMVPLFRKKSRSRSTSITNMPIPSIPTRQITICLLRPKGRVTFLPTPTATSILTVGMSMPFCKHL